MSTEKHKSLKKTPNYLKKKTQNNYRHKITKKTPKNHDYNETHFHQKRHKITLKKTKPLQRQKKSAKRCNITTKTYKKNLEAAYLCPGANCLIICPWLFVSETVF